MDNRDFKGIWIPKDIWLNKELSAVDKCLLAEISSLDNEEHCWASNKYFAEFLGVSESTVTRSLKKLEDLGIITVEMVTKTYGTARVVKMTTGCSQNDEGVSSNCLSNNIDNNTDTNNSISKDILSAEDEFNSHMYSKEELEGKQKKTKSKGKNLYTKCLDSIDAYTDIPELRNKLKEYLTFRLSIKDKPLYNVNQWNSMLTKLEQAVEDCGREYIDVVQQSIDKAWFNFYPIKEYTYSKKDVFSEGSGLSCEQSTDTAEQRAEILENSGRRSSF